MAARDYETPWHATDGLMAREPRRRYRTRIHPIHWQLRSLIGVSRSNTVYYPTGLGSLHVQELNTVTRKSETIAFLAFSPRCLVARNGWVCCGGEKGEFVAIRLEKPRRTDRSRPAALGTSNSNNNNSTTDTDGVDGADQDDPTMDDEEYDDFDLRMGESPSSTLVTVPPRLQAKSKKFGKDRINCITLWFPSAVVPLHPGGYTCPVAILSNNDKHVNLVNLDNASLLDDLVYPDFVNRTVLSPDGRLLAAICDDPFLYVHERVELPPADGDDEAPAGGDDADNRRHRRYGWKLLTRHHLRGQREEDQSVQRGSFAICFSSTGKYLAVGTQYGVICVFETRALAAPDAGLMACFGSSNPNVDAGAVRDMAFCPGPYDLLAWSEDHGAVGIADVRNGFVSRQIIPLSMDVPGHEHVPIEHITHVSHDFIEERRQQRQQRLQRQQEQQEQQEPQNGSSSNGDGGNGGNDGGSGSGNSGGAGISALEETMRNTLAAARQSTALGGGGSNSEYGQRLRDTIARYSALSADDIRFLEEQQEHRRRQRELREQLGEQSARERLERLDQRNGAREQRGLRGRLRMQRGHGPQRTQISQLTQLAQQEQLQQQQRLYNQLNPPPYQHQPTPRPSAQELFGRRTAWLWTDRGNGNDSGAASGSGSGSGNADGNGGGAGAGAGGNNSSQTVFGWGAPRERRDSVSGVIDDLLERIQSLRNASDNPTIDRASGSGLLDDNPGNSSSGGSNRTAAAGARAATRGPRVATGSRTLLDTNGMNPIDWIVRGFVDNDDVDGGSIGIVGGVGGVGGANNDGEEGEEEDENDNDNERDDDDDDEDAGGIGGHISARTITELLQARHVQRQQQRRQQDQLLAFGASDDFLPRRRTSSSSLALSASAAAAAAAASSGSGSGLPPAPLLPRPPPSMTAGGGGTIRRERIVLPETFLNGNVLWEDSFDAAALVALRAQEHESAVASLPPSADPRDAHTAGLSWSCDGTTLYIGTEGGIFEFHVNVKGRRFYPSVTMR